MSELNKGLLKIPELTSRELTGDETAPNSTATYVAYVVTDQEYFNKHESEVIFIMDYDDDGKVYFKGPYKTIFDGWTFAKKLNDKQIDVLLGREIGAAWIRIEAITTLINTQKTGAK